MRCKFCGSTSLHKDKQHKNFSGGKAVAGAVVFGPVGAAAGVIGKDQDGYRCGACGAFMDAPMDLMTEQAIDHAIAEAEAGRGTTSFQHYQRQYANIRANIPAKAAPAPAQVTVSVPKQSADEAETAAVKHIYRDLRWVRDCPVYVEKIMIHAAKGGDTLSLQAWNQGKTAIRSAYFQATVFDDTGDEVGKCQCVYQGLSVEPGQPLPMEKDFPLQTELAYRVELACEKVALADDTVWRVDPSTQKTALTDQPELESMGFPRLKYVREHLHEVSKLKEDSTLYLPAENEGFWQCVCGQPVPAGAPCPRCGGELEKLNTLLSQEHLQKLQQEHVKSVAAKRAKATMQLYEKAVTEETDKKYQKARELQKKDTEDSLTKAAGIYRSIATYKDSTKRAEECQARIPVLKKELEEAARKAAEEKKKQEEMARQQAAWEAEEAKKRAKRTKKRIAIIAPIAAVLVILCAVYMAIQTKSNTEKIAAVENQLIGKSIIGSMTYKEDDQYRSRFFRYTFTSNEKVQYVGKFTHSTTRETFTYSLSLRQPGKFSLKINGDKWHFSAPEFTIETNSDNMITGVSGTSYEISNWRFEN